MLSVQGLHFDNRLGYDCRFGKSATVATLSSSTMLACVSPAGGVGQIALAIQPHFHATEHSGLGFEYEGTFQLSTLLPKEVVGRLGASVFVAGGPFTNSTGLKCRIGDLSSHAAYISSSVVQCSVPVKSPGVYMVQVSTNGQVVYTSCISK